MKFYNATMLSLLIAFQPAVGLGACYSTGGAVTTSKAPLSADDEISITKLMLKTRSIQDLKNADQFESAITVVSFLLTQWNSRIEFGPVRNWLAKEVTQKGVNQALLAPALSLYGAMHLSGFDFEATKLGPLIATLNPEVGIALNKRQSLDIFHGTNLATDFSRLSDAHHSYGTFTPPSLFPPGYYDGKDPFPKVIYGPGSLFEKMTPEQVPNRRMAFSFRSNEMVAMGGESFDKGFNLTCKGICFGVTARVATTAGFVAGANSAGVFPHPLINGAVTVGVGIAGVVAGMPVISACIKECNNFFEPYGTAAQAQRQKEREASDRETARLKEKEQQDQKAKDKKAKEEEAKQKDSEKKDKTEKAIKETIESGSRTTTSDNSSSSEYEKKETMVSTPMNPPDWEPREPFDPNERRKQAEWQVRKNPDRDENVYEGDQVNLALKKKLMFARITEDDYGLRRERPSLEDSACQRQLKIDMATNPGQNIRLPPSLGPRGPRGIR